MLKITKRLTELRKAEHENTVQIIAALVVCWNERAYLPLGYSSMWAYLTEGLHYSEGAASRRFKAIKCATKFPQVIDMLRDHRTSLCALAKAESLLSTASNAEELLGRMNGTSTVEVERIVAAERPKPRKPREKVARVAVKHEDPLFAANDEPAESRVSVKTTLTEDRYDEFEKARAIISRKIPGANVEQVLNELVDHYLKSKAPRKPKRPTQSQKRKASSTKARHIPRATRDEVMLRDGERCTFKGPDGRRCAATHNLHIDHIQPYAKGGTHDSSNLRVLCAAHNQHEARKAFGRPPRWRSAEPDTVEIPGSDQTNARTHLTSTVSPAPPSHPRRGSA